MAYNFFTLSYAKDCIAAASGAIPLRPNQTITLTTRLPACVVLILGMIVLLCPSQSVARDDILLFTDVDPATPVERQSSSTDIGGQLLNFYLPYLAEFNIHQRFANPARALNIIGQRSDACRGKSVYTEERAAALIYTQQAHVVFPPLRLYMLASHPRAQEILELLDTSEDGFLPLADILQVDPGLTLGLMRGRSYTPELDQAIDADQHSNQLWIRAVADQASGLFDMLIKERIDLTIHTSIAVKRFTELRDIEPELVMIPLREASEPLQGYFVCSQSETGTRFLAAMDLAVNEVSHSRAYFDTHMSWVTPAERPFFARIYNQQFGTEFSL